MTTISRSAARLLAVAAALAVLAACGPAPAPLRLRAEIGRDLVYDAHRIDDWPDETFGYGGVLDTRARFRLSTEDAVEGRGGRYAVVIEAVAVDSPPRFGVAIDTDTPDPEEGDTRGVEDLARRLLRRRGELTIAEHGLSAGVEPDRELRELLKAWGDTQGDPRAARPVMMLLDELLDGPRVVAKWIQAPSLLFPRDTLPDVGSTWKRRAPPAPSPAGRLGCELTVHHENRDDGTVVLIGAGDFVLNEPLDDAPLEFVSGRLEAETVLDPARGVIVRYEERTEFEFRKVADGSLTRANWKRVLTLIE